MNTISVDRCLVIPDVHQDIEWVGRILDREPDWDHCVFLGDYFDTRRRVDDVAGIRSTAQFIRKLRERFGARVTFLWGNHDIPYWEAKKRMIAKNLDELLYPAGVPIRKSSVEKIFKEWDQDFASSLRLFLEVNGFLLSHAGLDKTFWPESPSIPESLGILEENCQEALLGIGEQEYSLLAAGRSRGGFNPVGGIIWNCWIGDFCDNLPLPQIVGHTASPLGVRQKGRSRCIDGAQTCYAVIEGSELRFGVA